MESSVNKTFVFEQQDTQQAILVNYSLPSKPKTLNLTSLFAKHCPLNINRVSLYDPDTQNFVSLDSLQWKVDSVPQRYLDPSFIFVRFISRRQLTIDSGGRDNPESSQISLKYSNGPKSKERTIGQVLELVKGWRDLNQRGHTSAGRRINLQDAAKMVGVSKKSLDDYYHQIRLGELYNFAFQKNLHKKIGRLRAYVKCNQKGNKTHGKLPQFLKIFNKFEQSTSGGRVIGVPLTESKMVRYCRPHPEQLELNLIGADPPALSNYSSSNSQPSINSCFDGGESEQSGLQQQNSNLENEFFRTFELQRDVEADPYYKNDRMIDLREDGDEPISDNLLFFT